MLSVFEFSSYRDYLRDWIEGQGSAGYGLKGRIAVSLGVSSSLLSQILKGEKALTPDQASDLADFMGLSDLEADFFHLLVDLDRAGSPRYQAKLRRKIAALQDQSRRIGKRVPRHKELTDEQRAIFYSSWLYTGVFNMTAIPRFNDINAMADHLRVEPGIVHRIIRFLVDNGICKEENGHITFGPANIHVDKESPFVNKHHHNWRFQGIQQMDKKRDSDIFFTAPVSLSYEAADEIRKLLPTVIQNVMKIVGPSPSEVAACLNIDWFEY